MAHLSNVFPSWTDYYCVIKKIKLGLLFFSEKSKEFHVISGIPILNSSLALSEVAGTHGYLLHRARASRRVTTPWSVWPLLPVPGGPPGQRWGPPSIPTLGRFGQSREGSGAGSFVSVADFSLCEPRGPWTQSLRRADLLSQASRGRAQNPCVQSSTAWLLSLQAPFSFSPRGEWRGEAFLVFTPVHLGSFAPESFV